MPRIRVDLLDIDSVAQVNKKPTAIGIHIKEEILKRLVLLNGNFTIVKLIDVASIAVPPAVHDSKLSFCSRVASGGRGNVLELETGRRVFVAVMADNGFDDGVRGHREHQNS
jgi:hypothetical protein